MTFNSLRAIKIHDGKKHKVTGSPIPQLDGGIEDSKQTIKYMLVRT